MGPEGKAEQVKGTGVSKGQLGSSPVGLAAQAERKCAQGGHHAHVPMPRCASGNRTESRGSGAQGGTWRTRHVEQGISQELKAELQS